MSTEDKLKTVSPTFGNTVLPAVVGSQTKYQIIYADPAWLYQCGKNHLGKKSMINGKIDIHYNGMPIKEMQKLNVNDIADENCLLFMWVTSPFLKIGIDLMNKWGFDFSTIGFVWNKEKTNPGSYTLSECEVCIIGKKGKIPTPRGARNIKQFLSEKRTRHSEKPNEVRLRIEKMFPTQNKIELFAREKCVGWHIWGNELENDVELETSANNGR